MIRRRVLDLVRFSRGAAARVPWLQWQDLWQPGALRRFRLLSVDVFETVLTRSRGAEGMIRAESAQEALRLCGLGAGSGPGSREVLALREAIERRLREAARARGEDPEVGLGAINRELLATLGGGEPDPRDLAALGAYELHGELGRTVPNREVVELMARAREEGLRVVAVSDMHFSADEVGWLFRQHGVPEPSRIYVSSDVRVGKFSGKLFRHVIDEEAVRAESVLHVGDRLLNDLLAPRGLGIGAVLYRRGKSSASRIAAHSVAPRGVGPAVRDGGAEAAGRALGVNVLGPVLTSFARLLLIRANRLRIERLLFVSRDGDLLREVVEIVKGSVPPALRLPTGYVHLSRRATGLAAIHRLSRDTVLDVFAVTTSHRTTGAVFAALNVDPALFEDHLLAHGLGQIDEKLVGGADDPRLVRLLADEAFQARFAEEAARQRALLDRFLRQEGFFGNSRLALVDVGWRGSTQTAVAGAFEKEPGFCELTGFYVGLWPDDAVPMLPDLEAKEGLISDCRRARTPLEGAAHYVSLLLEAACRAEHGTVLGYSEEASGAVRAVLAEGTGQRKAEEEAVPVTRAIRAGVLAFARSQAESLPIRLSPERERREAQKALLRLAFFPTRDEIEVGQSLVHTDRFSEGWHKTLLPREPASPLLQPRRWVSQLQSPWRGGVVAQTGGWPLSALYLLLESVLVGLPGGIRAALQRSLLSAAGLTSGGKR